MKDNILISIKPAFANLIVFGVKKVELRRSFPQTAEGKKCYIYSSSPTKAIIGECYITKVEKLPIKEIWEKHSEESMIDWGDFKNYFTGKEHGFAISVNKHIKYEESIALPERFSMSRPPQSFCYV